MNSTEYLLVSWTRYCLLFISLVVSSISFATDNAKISVKNAHILSGKNEIVLVDVRSEGEWAETGVASHAKLRY